MKIHIDNDVSMNSKLYSDNIILARLLEYYKDAEYTVKRIGKEPFKDSKFNSTVPITLNSTVINVNDINSEGDMNTIYNQYGLYESVSLLPYIKLNSKYGFSWDGYYVGNKPYNDTITINNDVLVNDYGGNDIICEEIMNIQSPYKQLIISNLVFWIYTWLLGQTTDIDKISINDCELRSNSGAGKPSIIPHIIDPILQEKYRITTLEINNVTSRGVRIVPNEDTFDYNIENFIMKNVSFEKMFFYPIINFMGNNYAKNIDWNLNVNFTFEPRFKYAHVESVKVHINTPYPEQYIELTVMAFEGCSNLREISLTGVDCYPANIDHLFKDCVNLETFNGVINMREYQPNDFGQDCSPFENAPKLKGVHFKDVPASMVGEGGNIIWFNSGIPGETYIIDNIIE